MPRPESDVFSAPAAGKTPRIAFILLDDYGYAPATRLEAYAPTA